MSASMVQAWQRQAAEVGWSRGAAAGTFASAYGPIERDEDVARYVGAVGVLSGEWADGWTPEDVARYVGAVEDDGGWSVTDAVADAFEQAYAAAYVALVAWADSDDEGDAPTFGDYAREHGWAVCTYCDALATDEACNINAMPAGVEVWAPVCDAHA